jgi:inhibitor of cysteine peptidase
MEGKSRRGVGADFILVMLIAALGAMVLLSISSQPGAGLERFQGCSALYSAMNESYSSAMYRGGLMETFGQIAPTAAPSAAGTDTGGQKAGEYSTTNIQVQGVDEADIVKTDGEYLYIISGDRLVIVRAYPAEEAAVVSETELANFTPQEMFIEGDILLLFGYSYESVPYPEPVPMDDSVRSADIMIYPYYTTLSAIQLWDVADRSSPEMAREAAFEGSYLTSRKIGSWAYFVINSYPRFHIMSGEGAGSPGDIVPLYRDSSATGGELEAQCGCSEVGYFEGEEAQSFITILSVSMEGPEAEIGKEVIVGTGQNVYASLSGLYIAETSYPWWGWGMGIPEEGLTETTTIYKFSMDNGRVEYKASGEVPGWVLNQFSMDEYEGHFRIATTSGHVSRTQQTSVSNVYVLDEDMETVGSLEGLAPGEQIYSARFMGDRAYLVTFRKIDPLFVLDLSDPANPSILGKLKIPGYSDYLHPYDGNHIIGIGKETVDAEEEGRDFSWHQGLKLALFDVSDVENPVEIHREIIGDRGTDSDALHDHRAFLFDRERDLLVIPVLLAEFSSPPEHDWEYGDFVYQGAYVYELTPEHGFVLRTRVTHYDSTGAFEKSGYYFIGDRSVQRSGYIDNTLWTLSRTRAKLTDLGTLSELASLDFGEPYEWGNHIEPDADI